MPLPVCSPYLHCCAVPALASLSARLLRGPVCFLPSLNVRSCLALALPVYVESYKPHLTYLPTVSSVVFCPCQHTLSDLTKQHLEPE